MNDDEDDNTFGLIAAAMIYIAALALFFDWIFGISRPKD